MNGKTLPLLLSALWLAILAAGGLWVNNLNEDVRRVARAVDAQVPQQTELSRRFSQLEASQAALTQKLDGFIIDYYRQQAEKKGGR